MIEIHPELARTLLEVMPVGVAFVDQQNRVVWANQALASLVGQAAATLTGTDVTSLTLPVPAVLSQPANPVGERVCAEGSLVGIAHRFTPPQFDGTALFVLHRAQFPAWALEGAAQECADVIACFGLLSRDAAQHRLSIEISRSRRYDNPLSCVIVRARDTATDGAHHAGVPQALHLLSRMLKEQLRWVDVLGMWDPDSLLLILPETSAEAVGVLTAKLAEKAAALFPAELAGITVDWGASTWRKGDDATRLLKRAEEACGAAAAPERSTATA